MTRWLAGSVAVLILASIFVVLGSAPASACSCSQIDTGVLDAADGALVGTVVDVNDGGGPSNSDSDWYVVTIDATLDMKGNLEDTVYVRTYRDDGANCGVNVRSGQAIAAVIRLDASGALETDGCSTTAPAVITAWTPPRGLGGEAEAFAATNRGLYRLVAYDAAGERIAFGYEDGRTYHVGLCEGDEAIVEVVHDLSAGNPRAELRRLESFEVVEVVALTHDGLDLLVEQISCRTDPVQLQIWAEVAGTRAEAGFVFDDGDLLQVEFGERPTTRTTRYDDIWPSVTTARGVVVEAADTLQTVYELPVGVMVPATGEAPIRSDLGAGLPAPEGAGGRAPIVIGVALVIATGIAGLAYWSRRRGT